MNPLSLSQSDYLSTGHAAAEWGVSRQAIWLAIRTGRFPAKSTSRIGTQYAVTREGMQAAFGPPRKEGELS